MVYLFIGLSAEQKKKTLKHISLFALFVYFSPTNMIKYDIHYRRASH